MSRFFEGVRRCPLLLHDALVWLGFVTEAEADARENWKDWLVALAQSRRAALLTAQEGIFWVPAERLRQFQAVYRGVVVEPAIAPPPSADQAFEPEAALVELVRGRLEGQGPLTLAQLSGAFGLPPEWISAALTALEVEGFALAGSFTPGGSAREWCERRLLARIHRYTVKRLRAEIEPVSARDFLCFLFDWQGVSPDARREGAQALDAVVEQLAGFAALCKDSDEVIGRVPFGATVQVMQGRVSKVVKPNQTRPALFLV
jgi:ATP-dependent helicase Lhr and Lhr-like helicase